MRETNIHKAAIEQWLKDRAEKENNQQSINNQSEQKIDDDFVKQSVINFLKRKQEQERKYYEKLQKDTDNALNASKKYFEEKRRRIIEEKEKEKKELKEESEKSFLDSAFEAIKEVGTYTAQGATIGAGATALAGPGATIGAIGGGALGLIYGIYDQFKDEKKEENVPKQLQGIYSMIDNVNYISDDEKNYLKKYSQLKLVEAYNNPELKKELQLIENEARNTINKYKQGLITQQELIDKKNELLKKEQEVRKNSIEKSKQDLKRNINTVLRLSPNAKNLADRINPNPIKLSYYINDKFEAVPYIVGSKLPENSKVASIWSSKSEDDSKAATFLKSTYNSLIEGLGGGTVATMDIIANAITGKDNFPALNTLKNTIESYKIPVKEKAEEELISDEAFSSKEKFWEEIKSLSDKPDALLNFAGEVTGSLLSFALGARVTGAGEYLKKGVQTIKGAQKAYKASEIGSKALLSAYAKGGANILPALGTGVLISNKEAWDAVEASGYEGREKGLIATLISLPIAGLELAIGNSATDFLTNSATKKALAKAGVNSLEKNGFKLTQETIEDAYKAMNETASLLSKKLVGKTKEGVKDLFGEIKEEFIQTAYQKAFEDLYDRIRLEEGDKSGFNSKFFSKETAKELFLASLGGALGGAFGSIGSFTGANKSYLKHLSIYDAIKTNNEDVLRHNLSELLKNKELSEEEYNAAITRINAYKRFDESTKNLTELKDAEKAKLFEAMMNLEYSSALESSLLQKENELKKNNEPIPADLGIKKQELKKVKEEAQSIINSILNIDSNRKEKVKKGEKLPNEVEEELEEAARFEEIIKQKEAAKKQYQSSESLVTDENIYDKTKNDKSQSVKTTNQKVDDNAVSTDTSIDQFQSKKRVTDKEASTDLEIENKYKKKVDDKAISIDKTVEQNQPKQVSEDFATTEDPDFIPRIILRRAKKGKKIGFAAKYKDESNDEKLLKTEEDFSKVTGIDFSKVSLYKGEDIEIDKPTKNNPENKILISDGYLIENESIHSVVVEEIDEKGKPQKVEKSFKSSEKKIPVRMFTDKNGNKYGIAINKIKKTKEGKYWGTSYLIRFPGDNNDLLEPEIEPFYVNREKKDVFGYEDLPTIIKELGLKPIINKGVKIKAIANNDNENDVKNINQEILTTEKDYQNNNNEINATNKKPSKEETTTKNKVETIKKSEIEEIKKVSDKYYYHSIDGFHEIVAEPIKLNLEGDFFIHQSVDSKEYTILEAKSGTKLISAKTKKEAIDLANKLLNEIGQKKLDNRINYHIQNHGLSPRYTIVKKGESVDKEEIKTEIETKQEIEEKIEKSDKKETVSNSSKLKIKVKKDEDIVEENVVNKEIDIEENNIEEKSKKEIKSKESDIKNEQLELTFEEQKEKTKKIFEQKEIIDNIVTIYEATMFEGARLADEINKTNLTSEYNDEITKYQKLLESKGLPSNLEDLKKSLWEIFKDPKTNELNNTYKWYLLAAFKQLDVNDKLRLKAKIDGKNLKLSLGNVNFNLAFSYIKDLNSINDELKEGVSIKVYNPNAIKPEIPKGLLILTKDKNNPGKKVYQTVLKTGEIKQYPGIIVAKTVKYPKELGNIAFSVRKIVGQGENKKLIYVNGLLPNISQEEAEKQVENCKNL